MNIERVHRGLSTGRGAEISKGTEILEISGISGRILASLKKVLPLCAVLAISGCVEQDDVRQYSDNNNAAVEAKNTVVSSPLLVILDENTFNIVGSLTNKTAVLVEVFEKGGEYPIEVREDVLSSGPYSIHLHYPQGLTNIYVEIVFPGQDKVVFDVDEELSQMREELDQMQLETFEDPGGGFTPYSES